jgi:16S rRNA (cytidine1402-2'-O)-methyltransferase
LSKFGFIVCELDSLYVSVTGGMKMTMGTLYLCPTPLGNLEDITLRVLRILKEVSRIAAEDTRHTRKLLSHFDIHVPLLSYHEHNKIKKTPYILERLLAGEDVALVSDAGTPGIADPGEELVREAIGNGIPVIALPGPVAAVTALSASGLPSTPFAFYGFIPARGKVRKGMLADIERETKTTVFYEAPHRLVKTLSELAGMTQKGRQVVVARELTKIHEEFIRGTLDVVLNHFTQNPPRGECTVVLEKKVEKLEINMGSEALVDELLATGFDKKNAIREAARRLSIPRREVYNVIHEKKIKSK